VSQKIIIRPQAALDLYDQAIYLARHASPETADRYLKCANDTFKAIARRPSMGRTSKYLNPSLSHTRLFRVQKFHKHVIFYCALKKAVEIIRVVHGARDLERLY